MNLSQIKCWSQEIKGTWVKTEKLNFFFFFFFQFQGGFYRLRTEKCSGELKVKADREETEAELQSRLHKTPKGSISNPAR